MVRRCVLLLLLMMSWVLSFAQETIFRNFSSLEYQGGTQNWDIKQLPDGRMAIANNSGLLIYDGAMWVVYPIRNYSTVRALYYEASSGRLYVGASNEFGYYQQDPFTCDFKYHSLSSKLAPANHNFGEIWKILPWGDRLVFQSKSHLFISDKEGHLKVYRSQSRIESMGIFNDHLIIASRLGLEKYNGRKCVALPGARFGKKLVVRAMKVYRDKLLVATQQNGIFIYDGKQLVPIFSELAEVLKANQIFSIDLQGEKLAIGTVRAGLIVLDMKKGSPLYLNFSKGLINNTVLSSTFDRCGNIWMGLDNGLSCAMPNVPYQNLVSERFGIGTGYASAVSGNTLYLGTNQGVFIFELPFCQYLNYRPTVPVSGISGQIWNLRKIGDTIYCCSDRGLFRIVGSTAIKIEGPDGTWNLCELKTRPGYLLAADYMGLVVLKKNGMSCSMVKRIPLEMGVSGNIIEDTDGTIWMSHWQKGVYHIQLLEDFKKAVVLQYFHANHGLKTDANNLVCRVDGKIYVSSADGFYRYDRRAHKLVYDYPMSKLFNTYGMPLKLTEGPGHDIWAQKPDYLALACRKGAGYQIDSTSYNGIVKSQQIGLGDMCPLGNGQAIINSNDGFYLVRNNANVTQRDNKLIVRRIISTNEHDTVVWRSSFVGEKNRHIILPHALNSLRIEFVLPEYLVGDAVSYSCLLENYDTRWSTTLMNSKEYTRLGKGNYIFRVKSYNRISGKTQETDIAITILPAWYETTWAYLLYFLLTCLAFYGLLKILKRHADRQLFIERAKRKVEKTQMQNEQLQNKLKLKSSELANSTMNSIHQNDILQKLDEEMSELSESVRREDKKTVVTGKINTIRANLQTYLNDDEGWSKFEENFNVVYDDFMKKLTEQYTNLKISDRKLCAYLRMGLSSKEMASLLNMSVRSIETARYRLRKKLNLESGDNLTDFLQNFGQSIQSKYDDKKQV